MNSNLKKIVMTALFAALACVATMSIRIPTPGTGGYIHPGDAIVILSGVVLGPSYGLLAAGIGSAMSDLLGGYFVYVPITFVIKGLIALFSGLVYQKIAKDSKSRYVAVLLGGVIDIVLVAGGYFICEFFLYGSSAAASIPANIIQGVGGLIISFVLYPVLMAIPDVKQLTYKTSRQGLVQARTLARCSRKSIGDVVNFKSTTSPSFIIGVPFRTLSLSIYSYPTLHSPRPDRIPAHGRLRGYCRDIPVMLFSGSLWHLHPDGWSARPEAGYSCLC